MTKNISVTAIQAWLVEHIAGLIGADPASIDVGQPFESFGLASRDVVGLSGDLEDWLELRLSPTLLYQYPTIARLAQHLADQLRGDEEETPPAEPTAAPTGAIASAATAAPAAASAPAAAAAFDLRSDRSEPIAIVGMACRFPGAEGPEEFWQLLRRGADAVTEVPPSRFDVDAVYDPRPDAPGKLYTRWGGFLRNVDRFDPHFFGISPREAAAMDPQQRLLLEATWEALEAAGQRPGDLNGSRTGVFVGISSNDYLALGLRHGDPLRAINPYSGTGTAFSVAAGRIAYVLGLQGPCVAVDTACSSSLVAVHLAAQSLRAGECDLAVAGGVNVILSPEGTIYFCRLNVMAHDGRCKTFDARADGYVRSEGCGMVVLKRLSDAQRDGDPILALIRGTAINQDGRSNGLTAPNPLAQQEVIRAALAAARVGPEQIDYVETHGTGTELGDPIEVNALAAVLGPGHSPDRPFVLGAVKANIGHAEAAAGVAGLIKVVLALQHGEIPPQPHVQRLNPLVDWASIPAVVPTQLMPWPRDNGNPRRAGLSSFGFSGTNAHAIIEEAPPPPPVERRLQAAYLLPLSARSPEALREMAGRWADFLPEAATDPAALHDICYTATLRRSHLEHRLTAAGRNAAELAEQLRAFARGETRPTLSTGRHVPGSSVARKVVFLFPGQGGQWLGMARGLLAAEPAFRNAMAACDEAIRRTGLADWSLLEQIAADEEHSRLLDDISVIQPALWAIQVSLAALWRSWGIEPAAVVGHSLGEVAAACVAGALTLDEAARVICLRSKLMARVSGRGAMAVVGLSLEEAEAALRGYEGRVSAAVSNGPRSTVISGDADAVDAVLAELAARDVFCRKVKVDVASHSPHMDPLRPELVAGLADLSPRPTTVPMISTVTGEPVAGEDLTADYWGRNLRSPVRFWPVIQRLAETGHGVFLELSPHPVLLTAVRDGLKAIGREGATLPSLRREEDEPTTIRGSLGALHCLGAAVRWEALYPDGGRVASLPPYPWQRERYWLEVGAEEAAAVGPAEGSRTGHPLLDVYVAPAVGGGLHVWETALDLSTPRHRYLADHRVQDAVMLPAAAYLELAQAAARQAFGDETATVADVTFGQALIWPDDGRARLQVVITDGGSTGSTTREATFQVFSSAVYMPPGDT
ncbi:MAG: beta-ketoacyl synthase N-terminal-like domain-containing protein, partial [Anaerolineae bacterium]|nr:beta-ketoacyl synthase N-terminal-like domain-containing protein [Anaerolineae bacterium]